MCSAWLDEDVKALHGMGATYGPAFAQNLVRLMAHESGCSPAAIDWIYDRDAGGKVVGRRAGAVGLIQFEPETLRGLGYHGDAHYAEPAGAYAEAGEDDRKKLDNLLSQSFARLPVRAQLPFVDAYMKPHAAPIRAGGLGVLYTVVFLPAEAEHAVDATYVLCGLHGPLAWAYTANHVFDTDGKGWITPIDLEAAAQRAYAESGAAQELAERLAALDPKPTTLPAPDDSLMCPEDEPSS